VRPASRRRGPARSGPRRAMGSCGGAVLWLSYATRWHAAKAHARRTRVPFGWVRRRCDGFTAGAGVGVAFPSPGCRAPPAGGGPRRDSRVSCAPPASRWSVCGARATQNAPPGSWRRRGVCSRSGTRGGASLYRACAPAAGPAPGLCRDWTSRGFVVSCIRPPRHASATGEYVSPLIRADGTPRPTATRPAAVGSARSNRVIIGRGRGWRCAFVERETRKARVASPMSAPPRISALRAVPSSLRMRRTERLVDIGTRLPGRQMLPRGV
jgi:hypothetical protein